MTIRAHELARQLLAGPNAVVTTWQNECPRPVEGCDSDIEQVVETKNDRGETVIVIGLDVPANDLRDADVVWSAK